MTTMMISLLYQQTEGVDWNLMTQDTAEWEVAVKNSVCCQFRQNWALFSVWVAASLSSL